MITVEEAEGLVLANAGDFGAEIVLFEAGLGRVLAENIKADRDLPPFNRVTMDGIAINYSSFASGVTTFCIKATQAAGDAPVTIDGADECIEIMTGAVLPASLDTVVRYEDLEISGSEAKLLITDIKQGQNIHQQGKDKKQGDVILTPGQLITPAVISLLASVGETEVRVKRLPRVVIISSGDELVEVAAKPSPYQIRRSNNYTIKAVLTQLGLEAGMLHIPDDPEITKSTLQQCLHNYDVILLSGGISMGKFDYIQQALNDLQVNKVFHKVQQRPGKPFWFGKHDDGVVVFAFPGNPVATFMCLHRYFIPWLTASLKLSTKSLAYAVLNQDFEFNPELKYFLQVKLNFNGQGQLIAIPVEGNGSGDFANLADTDAFMELPLEKNEFKKGEVYRIWPFNSYLNE
ncbi:MAG TPA: molybdopterin molybdotransferase MoeA [Mucilaginibacter sp.]